LPTRDLREFSLKTPESIAGLGIMVLAFDGESGVILRSPLMELRSEKGFEKSISPRWKKHFGQSVSFRPIRWKVA